MRVVIAGGHGKIAKHLLRRLAGRGDTAIGLVRNHDHVAELEHLGAQAVVIDLESASADELAEHLQGADAVVFAAGAGASGGAERKDTVDRGASVLLADAAEIAGVARFVQISAMGAGEPVADDADETWAAYVHAKTAAEEDLRGREQLAWTILRPGALTDADAAGVVTLAAPPLERGSVPRDDVAAVVVALLDTPGTASKTLVLTEGPTFVDEAVAAQG